MEKSITNVEPSHPSSDLNRGKQQEIPNAQCYYCHEKIKGNEWHPDHVVPIIRGGSDWPDNIVIACPKCNESKRDKLPHEWSKGGRLL